MSGYSKGPWEWEQVADGDGGVILWAGEDERGGQLAILEAPNVPPKDGDAALIAASPTMYELLRECAVDFDDRDCCYTSLDSPGDHANDCLNGRVLALLEELRKAGVE